LQTKAHDSDRAAARQRSVRDVLHDEAEDYGWTTEQIDTWVTKLEVCLTAKSLRASTDVPDRTSFSSQLLCEGTPQ
jgi:hypothetical protein